MIVDVHTHVLDEGHWPTEWWRFAAEQWAAQESGRDPEAILPKIEPGLIDPDAANAISAMDLAGVDSAVILPIDWGPDFHAQVTVEELNDHAVRVAHAHRHRLIPFVGIDPRRPGAAEFLEQRLSSGVGHGLKLYPSCGFYPDHARAYDLYSVCQEKGVPVLFHTGEPLPLLQPDFSHPDRFLPVVRDFPDLQVWLGHAGAPDAWTAALAVAEASSAACLELSLWVWDDATEGDELRLARHIAEARDRIGIERLLFGTDNVSGRRVRGPQSMRKLVEIYRRLPQTAEQAGVEITESELSLIMGGNAERMLGLVDRAPGSAAEN